MSNTKSIFTKNFIGMFFTQFFGAFNDNLLRMGFVAYITYKAIGIPESEKTFILTSAVGIFMLPFFLFSATAGSITDKFSKSKIMQISKIFELVIILMVIVCFMLKSHYGIMFVLFLMGIQSAFFGPAKYSILPDLVSKKQLVLANSYISAGTFIAILAGTILGLVLVSNNNLGENYLYIGLFTTSLVGLIASLYMDKTKVANKNIKLTLNIFRTLYENIKIAYNRKGVFICILAVSFFWFLGSIFLSQMPIMVKVIFKASYAVFAVLLSLFSVGIGIGSFLINKWLKGNISAKYAPFISLFMAGTLFFLAHLISIYNIDVVEGELVSIYEFFSNPISIYIAIDLFVCAILGGMYIVPLQTMIQDKSGFVLRSRIISALSISNAFFMVLGSLIVTILLKQGYLLNEIFTMLGVLTLIVFFIILFKLPDTVVKMILQIILKVLYRVEIRGLNNFYKCNKKALIIANHTSYLDAVVLAVFLPKNITFAINKYIAMKWWVRPFLFFSNSFHIDPSAPMAAKSLINEIKKGNKVALFPEGRITVTGAVMKIYNGTGLVAHKSKADVLPIHIGGAKYAKFFSLLGDKVKLDFFPKIVIDIMPPKKIVVPAKIKGRKRREYASDRIYKLMTEIDFKTSYINKTIFDAFIYARKFNDPNKIIAQDVTRTKITYNDILFKSFALGNAIKRIVKEESCVGIMLPNTNATLVSFFALHCYGKIPAMINFSSGYKDILSCCTVSNVETILTSKKFIEQADLYPTVDNLIEKGIKIKYLEDIRVEIKLTDKLLALLALQMPKSMYKIVNKYRCSTSNCPAVVLFTSGTEGVPKGVVLSHKNIQANIKQMISKIAFNNSDVFLNALPMFHSFGLTACTLLPILTGVKVVFYPSPLHYRVIPEMAYASNATILFGTDTFLHGYSRLAHQYDFYNIKYVFAGAEKIKSITHASWMEKFGKRIFEGYGTTETAPVISVNTPINYKKGSVGKIMPGIDFKLQTIKGVNYAKELIVKGPNVMLGYLTKEKPGKIIPPKNGWYHTGDLVYFDEEDYMYIEGRIKRFAKIAGEMVSLLAVEEHINKLYPKFDNAIISAQDNKKGEKLILVTNNKANKTEITNYFKAEGISAINLPSKIKVIDKIPLLGTGKINYKMIIDTFNKD